MFASSLLAVSSMVFAGWAAESLADQPQVSETIVAEEDAKEEELTEGYVDLEFVVNERGEVENPVVLYSTNSMFEEAALKAVLKFKYKPRMVDGNPVAVSGVKTRISFALEDEGDDE